MSINNDLYHSVELTDIIALIELLLLSVSFMLLTHCRAQNLIMSFCVLVEGEWCPRSTEANIFNRGNPCIYS